MANHHELNRLIVAMVGRPVSKWRFAPTLHIFVTRASRLKAQRKPREALAFVQPCEKGLPAYSDVALRLTASEAILFLVKLMLTDQLRVSAAVDSSILYLR